MTAIAWGGWPRERTIPTAAPVPAPSHHWRRPPALRALYVEYALIAAGLVPHMVFLVDFIARGLGRGLDVGGQYWVVFGIGAVVGPAITGHLADRIGFAHALRLALVVQTVAVALPSLAAGSVWLIVSSLVVGAMVPGIVPLVLGRVHELATADQQDRTAAWSFATVAFALGQAGTAYGLSFLFARAGDGYVTLFALGAGALALALTIDLVAVLGGSRSGAPPRSRR